MQKYLIIAIVTIFLGLNQSHADEQKPAAKDKQTICLNMIVKNESAVIVRCLASLKPIIDYWLIVDTGSTDGTQKIIRDFMKDVPGELYERPWVNFGHNRNEALQLAKGKADYVLFIDADETLTFDTDFKLPKMDKDLYYIMADYSGMQYARVRLINNHLDWKWVGVLHETVESPQLKTRDTLLGVRNIVNTDGARSKDPKKFQKDAQILEKGLLEEPNNSRYVFYLAQSYKDAGDYEPAIKNYQKRMAMGGWDQEIFWCLTQIAILQEILERPAPIIIEGYEKAYAYRPSRLEPLYHLASYYRRTGKYQEGYKTALKGINTPLSSDILFVERWIWDYGLLLEYSICSYWTERYVEALLASNLILAQNPKLPQNFQDCVKGNLGWINLKMAEAKVKEAQEAKAEAK